MGMTEPAGAALREAEKEIAAVLSRLQSKLGPGCSLLVDVIYRDGHRSVLPKVNLSATLRGGSV